MIGRREFITLLGGAAWAYDSGELALSSNSLVFLRLCREKPPWKIRAVT